MIFREIECCNCGVIFGASPTLDNNWRETKKTFYCPNGHGQSYSKSTAQRLQEQLDQKNAIIAQKNREIATLETKIKKPVKKVTKRKKATK
jgi:flagellar motility protein MotE (MotC chaperone)